MSAKKNSVLLEVDRSIIENNLLLEETDALQDLFPKKEKEDDDVSWKLSKPTPEPNHTNSKDVENEEDNGDQSRGRMILELLKSSKKDSTTGICVKTRTSSGDKIFINVCQTPDIPAPEDINEAKLVEIWSSDEHTSFRVPMSIGEAHVEEDKSENPVLVYDVAINPEFFKKTQSSKLFLSFLLTVVMEGIQDKYTVKLETEDYVILKNRKVMGELKPHRVRQGDKKKKPAGPLIEEVFPPMQVPTREPQYRIRREPPHADPPEYLLGEIILKDLASTQGVTLDIGEDRILLEGPSRVGQQAYKLDVFIPFSVNQDECTASFNRDTKVLSVKMPIAGVN